MFKNIVNRLDTNCAKWDELIEGVGNKNLISLTVADMDFPVAVEVENAIIKAAVHGIYGYTNVSKKYIELTKRWIEEKYHWAPKEEWIVFCPRVIQALSLIIQNCTNKEDKVMLFTPLYSPIQEAVKINERKLVSSSLLQKNGRYEIDFDDFERKAADGVKLFVAVSPHNPVGRVWSDDEIKKIIEICQKHNIVIFSDEVHADFIWKDEFTSFGKYYDLYDQIVIGTSAAKTFNIAGLEASGIILKNRELRELFQKLLRQAGIHNPNYFCIPAVEAAYEYGDEWLHLVKQEIKENIKITRNFFNQEVDGFYAMEPEGTYMLWVDYKKTGMLEAELYDYLIKKAEIAFSMGSSFGPEGDRYFRVNVAMPQVLLVEALKRFKENMNWREIYERKS